MDGSQKILDQICINTIRTLAMDAGSEGKFRAPRRHNGAGTSGLCFVDPVSTLQSQNPKWFNRDRFVLSNGHASMLQTLFCF
jgi:transketolase